MKGEKLANIQWQWLRNSIWVSLITMVIVVFLLTLGEKGSFSDLYHRRLFGVPLLLFIPFISLLIGGTFGYVVGESVRKRLEQLHEGTMALERGNFANRIKDLGNDEIGLIGKRLNSMARRVEEQVASLQRLSTERAEWQETIKQSAVNEERQRLARDLHDAVSQQLFAISMMAAALPHTLDKSIDDAKKQINLVESMAASAQSEMRALLLHLRPTHLEGKQLDEAIIELLTELRSKHSLEIEWKMEKTSVIPKGIEDHLFRIVQEACSNILRHSKAEKVEVQLREINGQIRLKVLDNGIGFEPIEKTSSYGLKTMNERVNEIGGVLEIISLPGKGTQVEVKVPLVHGKKEYHD